MTLRRPVRLAPEAHAGRAAQVLDSQRWRSAARDTEAKSASVNPFDRCDTIESQRLRHALAAVEAS
jgi:hypothetical protein